MKVCLIADLHLFSSELGGNWPKDSFTIFKEKILPKIEKIEPEIVVFLGDTLDPHSGRAIPTWPRGDEASWIFVDAIKKTNLKNIYALKGNHDYVEPLRNISEMGGPSFIDNDWLVLEDVGFYFFSSRYPNLQKAIDELESIPEINVKKKILLMHENLSIKDAENIPKEIMEKISKKFDVVFNGHQHAYDKLYENVYCLSSVLPWRVGYGSSDIEIVWKDDEPEIKENKDRFGFWIFDTDKSSLKFIPIDIGLKTVVARLYFLDAPASMIRERLIKLSKLLSEKTEPEKAIVRVYIEGTLKKGDERIDVGFSDIEEKYYSNFYEGRSRNIIRVRNLMGGGAYLSKEDLRYISVEDALKQLEKDIPKIREFYEEVHDLIERKSFDGDALIDRIKNSKVITE